MPAKYVERGLSERGIEPPASGHTGADLELMYRWAERFTERFNLEFLKVLLQMRTVVNGIVGEFNQGSVQLGTGGPKLMWGIGVPTADPGARALYINNGGGAGTTLYVWEGAAWAAK